MAQLHRLNRQHGKLEATVLSARFRSCLAAPKNGLHTLADKALTNPAFNVTHIICDSHSIQLGSVVSSCFKQTLWSCTLSIDAFRPALLHLVARAAQESLVQSCLPNVPRQPALRKVCSTRDTRAFALWRAKLNSGRCNTCRPGSRASQWKTRQAGRLLRPRQHPCWH